MEKLTVLSKIAINELLFLMCSINCKLFGQEGAEAGASMQRHQGGVLAPVVLAGELAMMSVIGTTTDREETVSIGQVSGKTEGSQVSKYQEADKIRQSHLIRIFNEGNEVLSNATQLSKFTFVSWKTIILIFSEGLYLDVLEYESHIMSFFFSFFIIFFLPERSHDTYFFLA